MTEVNLGNSIITMTLRDDTKLITRIPRTAPPELLSALSAKGVTFSQTRPGPGKHTHTHTHTLTHARTHAHTGDVLGCRRDGPAMRSTLSLRQFPQRLEARKRRSIRGRQSDGPSPSSRPPWSCFFPPFCSVTSFECLSVSC